MPKNKIQGFLNRKKLSALLLLALGILNQGCAEDRSLAEEPAVLHQINGFNSSRTDYRALAQPLWEKAHPKDGRLWTIHAFNTIESEAPALLGGSSDIKSFCPKYFVLNRQEKITFWVFLLSGMTQFESNHNPYVRYHERSMGKDRVTKRPVYSEGLLQLSYQDSPNHPACEDISWQKDKHLHPLDKRKTIFNPYINLTCGIGILNRQIRSKDKISLPKNMYWAVLKARKGSKVTRIMAYTRQLPFCN